MYNYNKKHKINNKKELIFQAFKQVLLAIADLQVLSNYGSKFLRVKRPRNLEFQLKLELGQTTANTS